MHALTALNRNGHTGTGHEQRHDSEQRGARSTGERQLGDGLHVLHGGDLVIGRQSDLMEEILLEKVTVPFSAMLTSKVTLKFWA